MYCTSIIYNSLKGDDLMVYGPLRKRNIFTTPEDKIKAVERVLAEHIPTKQMAEEMNVSRTSIQQWVKQYKDFGPASFLNIDAQKRPMSLVDAEELARLQAIEVAYEEQQIQVEILKKFQTFLNQK
jgi:transposase